MRARLARFEKARFTPLQDGVLRSVVSTPKTEPPNRKARFTVLQNSVQQRSQNGTPKALSKVYSGPKQCSAEVENRV